MLSIETQLQNLTCLAWNGVGGGKSEGNVEGQVENTLAGVDSESCGSQGLKLAFA